MSSSKRKKERRRLRYERNVRKEKEHKAQAWAGGKLIEENHNNKEYSQQYTHDLAYRLVNILKRGSIGAQGDNERFVGYFRMYRMKIRDLLILWSDEEPKELNVYGILKDTIETYWDNRESLLSRVCYTMKFCYGENYGETIDLPNYKPKQND